MKKLFLGILGIFAFLIISLPVFAAENTVNVTYGIGLPASGIGLEYERKILPRTTIAVFYNSFNSDNESWWTEDETVKSTVAGVICRLYLLGGMYVGAGLYSSTLDLEGDVTKAEQGVAVTKHLKGDLAQTGLMAEFGYRYGFGPISVASSVQVGSGSGDLEMSEGTVDDLGINVDVLKAYALIRLNVGYSF